MIAFAKINELLKIHSYRAYVAEVVVYTDLLVRLIQRCLSQDNYNVALGIMYMVEMSAENIRAFFFN